MCKTRFDSQGVILNGFLRKKMKKKNLNGTQEPPSHGKCHSKIFFFNFFLIITASKIIKIINKLNCNLSFHCWLILLIKPNQTIHTRQGRLQRQKMWGRILNIARIANAVQVTI